MRLRPYKPSDLVYVQSWIQDARTHALWCANRLPYPFCAEDLQNMLGEQLKEWGSCAYTFTEDDGRPVGFLLYNIKEEEDFGFAHYIVVDASLRGKGYGTQMLTLLLKYAFTITNVSTVRLNVFDANERAKRCYEKAGFTQEAFTPNALEFEGESWGRCLMAAKRSS